MLANWVDFTTANPKVLNMAGIVLVLASIEGSNFILIRVKISCYEADKRNNSHLIGFLKKIQKLVFPILQLYPVYFFCFLQVLCFHFFAAKHDLPLTVGQRNHKVVKYWPKLFFGQNYDTNKICFFFQVLSQ